MLSTDEMANVRIIGKVETEFGSFQWFHINRYKGVGNKAYKRLKKEAVRKYSTTNLDVVNVYAKTKSMSYMMSINPVTLLLNIFGSNHRITATGDVISVEGEAIAYADPKIKNTPQAGETDSKGTNAPIGLEEAVKKASSIFINKLPVNSKIAVVNVESDDRNDARLVIDGIEFHLVSSERFTIVDRNTLDVIRNEQRFQTSGAVSDADIVQIGELSGANVVITGSVIKSENSNRLSLKALDVKTGQIITMARGAY